MTLIEVLEHISGYKEIENQIFSINDEVEISGTLGDFQRLRKELDDESNFLRKVIYKLESEINHPISSIDVYNYFKKLTNDFSPEETEITLKELIVFRDMELYERLNHLAKIEYIKNGWTIPTYTKTGKLGKFEFENFEEMRKKVFPFHGYLFHEAIYLLKSQLENTHNHKMGTKNKLGSEKHGINSKRSKHPAKHYALAFILECHALGRIPPSGKKAELEQIGYERIGPGKGNRFYKAFNEIFALDLNVSDNLTNIGGENWKEVILFLSNHPNELEEYLKNKKL